ncbi:MAG: dihydroorotase [Patescibacteria group bacterium]
MAKNIITLPGLIDPHVHFRVPGGEHKEDWITGARAALAGGFTTVIDMPNNNPPTTSQIALAEKRKIIDEQLRQAGIPLHHYFYLGAAADNLDEFGKTREKIIGIKLFMGASTGELLVNKLTDQEKIFQHAAELNLLVAVHAEDEEEIQKQKNKITNSTVVDHSKIRSCAAAVKAVTQAIELAKKHNTRLYICHVSTAEEMKIIKDAKKQGIIIYAEATPHHLFLNESAYAKLGTLAQMNPPLRAPADCAALWQGIADGTIDTIGSDHAPHTLAEKSQPYPASPSGVPGIETTLPLLLTAQRAKKISLEKIIELTYDNPRKIFNLPKNDDKIIVDLNLEKEVINANLKTKCGWSPFAGWKLTGWPVAVTINNKTVNF